MTDDIGPALPPGFMTRNQNTTKSDVSSDEVSVPHIASSSTTQSKTETDTCHGPALPPSLSSATKSASKPTSVIGPALPPGFRSSSHTQGVI